MFNYFQVPKTDSIAMTARFHEISAKDPEAHLETILLPTGKYVGSREETLNHLLYRDYPRFNE